MPKKVDPEGLKYAYLDSNNDLTPRFYDNINNVNESPIMQSLKPYTETFTENYGQIFWND